MLCCGALALHIDGERDDIFPEGLDTTTSYDVAVCAAVAAACLPAVAVAAAATLPINH